MKKNNYSIINSSCTGSRSFVIHEIAPTSQIEEGTVMSQANVFKDFNIGSFKDVESPCCFFNSEVGSMNLHMYDQHLSLAETYDRFCLGLHLCSHEIVVMTPKRVEIGKIKKSRVCCTGNNEGKIIYRVKISACQIQTFMPKCLSWLCCGKPVDYEIVNPLNQIVGSLKVFTDDCCSFRQRYEIKLPEEADTKGKILLMNSIALLN